MKANCHNVILNPSFLHSCSIFFTNLLSCQILLSLSQVYLLEQNNFVFSEALVLSVNFKAKYKNYSLEEITVSFPLTVNLEAFQPLMHFFHQKLTLNMFFFATLKMKYLQKLCKLFFCTSQSLRLSQNIGG